MAGFWLLAALSSLLSWSAPDEGVFAPSLALGFLRPILVAWLFSRLGSERKSVLKGLAWFVYLAIPIGLLGVMQALNFTPAVGLTVDYFSSGSRAAIANQLVEYGRMSRAVGVFEAPSYAAVYYLLTIGTGLWLTTRNTGSDVRHSRILLFTGVLAAFAAGVLTLSSTFIAGFAAMCSALILFAPWRARLKVIALAVLVTLVALPTVATAIRLSPVAAGSLRYQLERLSSLDVYATRFGSSGLLLPTIDAITERPLIGWGFFSLPNVFLGDSAYVVCLFLGGMIGAIICLLALLSISSAAIRNPVIGSLILIWLVTLLATSLGSPAFTMPRVADWWWALAGICTTDAKSWRLNS
ncbi:MAG: hypothetical protein M9914_12205 [Trueperaceae bacterium]|nr:hypothetical protein [Trueperaceae bacterium]